jgi:hypothetical protein
MHEETPWEKEELERWRRAESKAKTRKSAISNGGHWAELLSRYSRMQWAVIAVVNLVAFSFYLEIIFFPYRFFNLGGFEFVTRSLFSDLIAETQRKKRNFPLMWWFVAFLFPLPMLINLYFFPFEEERPQRLQRKYDICFAVSCAVYWLFLQFMRIY